MPEQQFQCNELTNKVWKSNIKRRQCHIYSTYEIPLISKLQRNFRNVTLEGTNTAVESLMHQQIIREIVVEPKVDFSN